MADPNKTKKAISSTSPRNGVITTERTVTAPDAEKKALTGIFAGLVYII